MSFKKKADTKKTASRKGRRLSALLFRHPVCVMLILLTAFASGKHYLYLDEEKRNAKIKMFREIKELPYRVLV